MRTLVWAVVMGFGVSLTMAQTNVVGSLEHDGQQRSYRLHLPPSWSPASSLPLVLNLHGFTSNAEEQEGYSQMNAVADTAGFAVCYPDGLNAQWNVGWLFNVATDDVGFLRKLVDTLTANYGLDAQRVYSCGMSNGGFMSYRLACEAPDVFAAVGSVTGGMAPGRRARCDAEALLPVLQIHGTADDVVAFDGSLINDPIDTTVAFWAGRSGCTTVDTSSVPDVASDGLTSTRYRFGACAGGGSAVEYYVVDGGGHTWPGAPINTGVTTQDFSASEALWQFFRQFRREGGSVSASSVGPAVRSPKVWPTPTRGRLYVEDLPARTRAVVIWDALGRVVMRKAVDGATHELDLRTLSKGRYVLQPLGCTDCAPVAVVVSR